MADPLDDRSTLAGRLSRYAKVGGTMAGVATRFAAQRLTGGFDPASGAADLKAALGGLKGPVMKMAQILSTVPGALPEDYQRELAQLQANAPAMGWPFVKRRMAGELGPDWQARFAAFSHAAVHAASLGQVHKATLPGGEPVAVKLQYPGMASAIDADLDQLDVGLKAIRAVDRSIDFAEIREELAARLREELDYALEARHMRLFAHMLADAPGVHVPQPVADLSTARLLTMQWLPGRPLLEAAADTDQAGRDAIAANLFHAWYAPLHRFGVIHGDPHMGNYTARPDHSLNLLDFGCVRVFPPRFIEGVVELYRALWAHDRERIVHAYGLWGFTGLSNAMIDTLTIWARFLYRPLLQDAVIAMEGDEFSADYGRETAQRVHAGIRRLGTVRIPREFVFMDRAAVGLGGVFMRLRARANWHRMFEALIADFTPERLAARQGEALAAAGLAA
jgi:predicted unusual protein kinase regulating ubiquinone biosynthesis (AarF/ABC1/UbiB family)